MQTKHLTGLILGLILAISAACTPATTEVPPTNTLVPTREASTATARVAADDFELKTPDGTPLALSDFRGQIVLVNFWATWCPACNAEMSALETYYENHKAEGFVIVAVNYKDSAEAVTAFIAKEALSFPVVLDTTGRTTAKYGVNGIPTSFFVDRDGNLLGYWPGGLTNAVLEKNLTPILQSE